MMMGAVNSGVGVLAGVDNTTSTGVVEVLTGTLDTLTLQSGQPPGSFYKPLCVAVSDDRRYLAVGTTGAPGNLGKVDVFIAAATGFELVSSVGFTTSTNIYALSFSGDGAHLVVALSASPYVAFIALSSGQFAKLANPATLPTGACISCSMSADGNYAIVCGSGRINYYARSGSTWANTSAPSPYSVIDGQVSLSADNTYVAISTGSSPYVEIFSRGADGAFTAVANVTTTLTASLSAVALSRDGRHLAIGVNSTGSTPFMRIYYRATSTFANCTLPSTVPTYGVKSLDFTPDGRYLFVGAQSSAPMVYSVNGSTVTYIGPLPAGELSNATSICAAL
jgi:WD40 repeat protein